MTLRLSVVSEHGARLGSAATKLFSMRGGSIGRGSDNEWILPDPERYLSGKHARVDFRSGTYVLVDTSSNGTFVNGALVPLGRFHDYQLKDGDYVRVGEYELLVSIDKRNDAGELAADLAADRGAGAVTAGAVTAGDVPGDLAADLDLGVLLDASDASALDSGVRPRDAYGQTVDPTRDGAARDEDASATPWHMMTRPLKVTGQPAEPVTGVLGARMAPGAPAAPTHGAGMAKSITTSTGMRPSMGMRPTLAVPSPRSHAAALFDANVDPGLAALCRGAGVDPNSLTPDARGAALHLAGQLLRESMLGLMDLNHSHSDLRNRFRIPLPDAGPDSPLNFSKGVDAALVRLLATLSTRAGSVEAVRHNFRELKAQNVALVVAMRAAFEEFLERVDPKELEQRFERAAKRGVFGTQNKGKYWDLYAEMFSGLAQRPADGFPHLFTETFAKAFEAKLRTLVPPRRSAFGADRADITEPDDKAAGDS